MMKANRLSDYFKRSWYNAIWVACSLVYFATGSVVAQDGIKASGFLDFNAYYDSRNYAVLTYNLFAKLPSGIQYFSLTNYQGSENNSDLSVYYSEHNLRYPMLKDIPIDATYQYVGRTGLKNDKHRLGIRLRLHGIKHLKNKFNQWRIKYSVNPMFVEFGTANEPKYATIIEHVYHVKFFKNYLYLAGFADQNFISTSSGIETSWVTEHQLGFRIKNEFYAVLEYRINEFDSQPTGLGIGIEYKVKF